MKSGTSAAAPVAAPALRAPQPASEIGSAGLTGLKARMSGGTSLPASLRSRMEMGFGGSFGDVRVHTGAAAAEATGRMRAEAFASGTDIAFAPGRYAPGTVGGDRLIAHELAHVVQQRQSGSGGAVQASPAVSSPGDASEVAADRAADTVLAGGRADIGSGGVSLRGRILRRALAGAGPLPSPVLTQASAPGAISPATGPRLTPVMTASVSPAGGQISGLTRPVPGTEATAKTPDEAQTAKGTSDAEVKSPAGVMVAGASAGGEKSEGPPEAGKGPSADSKTERTEKQEKKEHKKKQKPTAGAASGSDGGGGGDNGGSSFGKNLGDRGEALAEAARERLDRKALALETNEGAGSRIAAARAAAAPPANAAKANGQRQQTATLAGAEVAAPDSAGASARAQTALDGVTPATIEELDSFAGPGGAVARAAIAQSIGAEADAQAAPVRATMTAVSTPPDGTAPPAALPAPEPLAAPGTAEPALAGAVPPPVPEASLDATEFKAAADDALSAHDIDDATLAKADEGPLRAIGDDKKDLNTKVETAAETARGREAEARGTAQSALAGAEAQSVGEMQAGREAGQQSVSAEQEATQVAKETGTQSLADQINDLYSAAEAKVTAKLGSLQENAVGKFREAQAARLEAFSAGVRSELEAFKTERYSGAGGLLRRGRDWLLSINSVPEVKALYQRHRAQYIADIDVLLGTVKTDIETTIADCKQALTDARTAIDALVAANGTQMDAKARAAVENARKQFTAMEARIEITRTAALAALDAERERAIKEMDSALDTIRSENAGLVEKIAGAIAALADFLGQFMALLARVTRMGVGNFLSAAGSQAVDGVRNNLWDQLQGAFKDWIFMKLPVLQIMLNMPPNWLEMLSTLAASMIGLFTENLPAMLPAIGAAAMIWLATTLAAKLIPGFGAIMVVIDGIRAASGLVQSLFSATSAFLTFVMQVAAPGNGAMSFAKALAHGIVAAVDVVMTFLGVDKLIKRVIGAIAKPFGKVIDKIKARFRAFLDRRRKRADARPGGRKSKADADDGPDAGARKSARDKADRDHADDDRRRAQKDKGKDDKNKKKESDADRKRREKDEEDRRNKEKLDKAVAAVRPAADSLLTKGVSRLALRAQLAVWRLRYGIRVLELDPASGTIEAANSPKVEVTRVLRDNPDGVYKLVKDIAVERWKKAEGRANLDLGSGGGKPGKAAEPGAPKDDFAVNGRASRTPSVKEGDPAEQGALQRRQAADEQLSMDKDKPGWLQHGGDAPVSVGPETIIAKQGSGKAESPNARGNIVIPDLGTYPQITAQLLRMGFSPTDVAKLIMGALKPTESTALGRRLFALLLFAEPGRRPIASVTSPLAIASMLQNNVSLPKLFGDPAGGPMEGDLFGADKLNPEFKKSDGGIFVPGGGILPASAVGAAAAGRRTDARIIEGESFREGTKIAGQSEADLLRTVEVVYQAVRKQSFKDMGGLEREVRKLLDMFDKALGVRP
jgi:hypothetical protein